MRVSDRDVPLAPLVGSGSLNPPADVFCACCHLEGAGKGDTMQAGKGQHWC